MAVAPLSATFLGFAFLIASIYPQIIGRPVLERRYSYFMGSKMTVKNGLYSIRIEMKDDGRGHATGVIVLLNGQILGGDSHFYYTGSYTSENGKWRGELTTC